MRIIWFKLARICRIIVNPITVIITFLILHFGRNIPAGTSILITLVAWVVGFIFYGFFIFLAVGPIDE